MSIAGVAPDLGSDADLGGVPVAGDGAPPGSLIDQPGQLQYGNTLFGAGSRAGWRDLEGWRSLSGAETTDVERPLGRGSYAGEVYAEALEVTFTYLVRGTRGQPAAKIAALATIERALVRDGVERPLVVHDGEGAHLRMARVIDRQVPQGAHFAKAPVECTVTFLCADPRRYSVQAASVALTVGQSIGGVDYPAAYPLDYGLYLPASAAAHNDGTADTPVVIEFNGPLVNPIIRAGSDWTLGFVLALGDGETLTVDTAAGTVLLNGQANRMHTITTTSSPVELAYLRPGSTELTLTAASGTGNATVAWRHARE